MASRAIRLQVTTAQETPPADHCAPHPAAAVHGPLPTLVRASSQLHLDAAPQPPSVAPSDGPLQRSPIVPTALPVLRCTASRPTPVASLALACSTARPPSRRDARPSSAATSAAQSLPDSPTSAALYPPLTSSDMNLATALATNRSPRTSFHRRPSRANPHSVRARENRRCVSCDRVKIDETGFLAVITGRGSTGDVHQNNERFSGGRGSQVRVSRTGWWFTGERVLRTRSRFSRPRAQSQ